MSSRTKTQVEISTCNYNSTPDCGPLTTVHHCVSFLGCNMTDLVSEYLLAEGVVGQSRRIPLDESHIVGFGEDPESPLFVAHAAVALRSRGDLWKRHLVYIGCAVAVGAVGLEWCFLVAHGQ